MAWLDADRLMGHTNLCIYYSSAAHILSAHIYSECCMHIVMSEVACISYV